MTSDSTSSADAAPTEGGARPEGAPLRVLVLFGTRPEAVKLAPVVAALRRRQHIHLRVAVTGQHREMLDQVLETFGIRPDLDMELMSRWGGRVPSLAELTSHAVAAIDDVLVAERPDVVLVQGDTTTAFAGALAAFYRRIPVGHVEAGLRTNDRYNPFPEEANRRLVGALATLHFAPTAHARDNLLREGVTPETVLVTGNPVVDALQGIVQTGQLERASLPSAIEWLRRWPATPAGAARGNRITSRLLLVTLHRRESWGAPMEATCRALRRIVDETPDIELLFPVHRNPLVRDVVEPALAGLPRVHLIEPLDYVSFLYAQHRSFFVITDSGGVQEEAPALGKPVLVIRDTTERPEGVAAGTARLVGTREEAVYAAARQLLDDPTVYAAMAQAVSPYGDGRAAERIVDALLRWRHSLSGTA